ncbi:hypothetical protein Entcl_0870 [[Enterobacter] lignolyticus SCF1]|uniref:Uncharacterized protein n=1 Tax=Enterobacter lignolyticus (strain SCF1) TaxID=701347 RepID=E3G4Z4_ENTLS|nr:hypothetical protein Entcl_0870 [[Enterobacter] lignolyticus SCF1]
MITTGAVILYTNNHSNRMDKNKISKVLTVYKFILAPL